MTDIGDGQTDESSSACPDPATRMEDLHCPDCGYSLRGLESERCPECGLRLDFIDSATTAIAWVERKQRGRVRTYVATAFAVLFRNKRFCREIYRPISYADAQRFRWVSITLVAAIVVLCLVDYVTGARSKTSSPGAPAQFVFAATSEQNSILGEAVDEFGPGMVIAASMAGTLAVVLTLIVLTGVPSYLFHPAYLSMRLRNRAIALSFYACGPFVLTLACLVVFGYFTCFTSLAGIDAKPTAEDRGVMLLAIALGAVSVYWVTLVLTARRALLRPLAAWRVVILVPLLWLVAGGLTLLGVPLVGFYLWLILGSLF
jgi:hypothetical protein